VFDLSEVIYRAVEMSKTWWQTVPQKRGIKIAVQTDLDPECLVLGREGEIFEVIINIIKNAVEALPRGGNILIETCREDGRVKARIRDNGHGIPEPHLRKVFEPFFTTKGFSSAGMGLSSSYGIIAAHQGELSVQSTLGQGSAFTICLPALRRQKSYESTPSTHEKNALSPLTILVIDDMPAVLSMLDRNLGALGWRTLSARSGVEGLRLFRGNRCDVVICDAGMPHMNGWEVGRRLRLYCHDRQIPKPPFILLSGWGDTVRNMEESGVDTVVEKPIDMAKLLQAIRGIGVAA
jgi:CheY-like chemotaxis protein